MEQKNKTQKFSIKLALTSIIILTTLVFSLLFGCSSSQASKKTFKEVLNLINENSIVVDEVSYDELIKKGVTGVLAEDKFAKYYTKEEYNIDKSQDKGDYSGFGFSFVGKTNEIYSVVYNSPAEKAGVKVGDAIIKTIICGKETEIKNFDDLSKEISTLKANDTASFTLKKPNGQEYLVTINKENYKAGYIRYQDNEKELRVRTDKKGNYYLDSIEQNKNSFLDNTTAYIEITEFGGDLKEQLKMALNHARDNQKTQLILDLRNNGGGSVSILQDVCSLLLPTTAKKGDLLINAKLKNREKNINLNKKGTNDFIKKTVVLANKNTASASEALIGAMHFYGAGNFSLNNLVCEYNDIRKDYSTYGKGIMQTTFSLSSGGAIKMTTAKINWPDNRTCIHGVGIVPKAQENCVKSGKALDRAIELLSR